MKYEAYIRERNRLLEVLADAEERGGLLLRNRC